VRYGPIEATLDREQGANCWLTFAIREGKNREVRKVLETLNLKVNRLIRVSFGPFNLGELPEWGVKEVESKALRTELGEKIVSEANADFDAPLIDHAAKVPPRHSGASQRPEPGIQKQPPRSRLDSGSPLRGSQNDEKEFGGKRGDKKESSSTRNFKKRFQKRRDRSGGPRPSRPK
jgi:23S rRNA pseudouridine2605 synthase